MDLAELGIIFVAEGADAAIAKMADYKDVAAEVVQGEEERVKAAGKLITATANLSDQIARSTVAMQGSRSAQFEFQAIAMGVNEQLAKQIAFLKDLEDQQAFQAEASKANIQWMRAEEGALLDLARDIQYMNKVRAEEAAQAEANRKKELASREAYYAKIVADAKAAEQAIVDAKHKAILDAQNATAKAAAMYIKDEQERVKVAEKAAKETAAISKKAADDAIKQAEQKAMSEISWAKKSRDEQIRIKEEIAAYKSAGISDKTIQSTFGSGAVEGTIKQVNTLAEKWDHVTLNTSRARSEMVVLAHEAIQGRFSRIPASMMVFAEYTDLTALALSGTGLAIMGVTAAAVGLTIAIVKGVLEQRELQNALIMTGNFAGSTEGQLNAMAHATVAMGGSIATAKGVILDLASSGKFTATQIDQVATAVVRMEYATGSGEEGVKKLVDAFKTLQVEANSHSRYSDQITQAVLKLDAQYHFLTTSVLEQIRALEAEGKAKEASALATNEFAKATESRALEIVGNLGNIEKGWRSIKEAIGEAWSAMKDWGKTETAQDKLKSAASDISWLDKFAWGPLREDRLAAATKRYNDAWKELNETQKTAEEQGENARKQSEANVATASMSLKLVQMKADKEGELARKIRETNNELEKRLASPTITEEGKAKATQEAADLIEAYEKAAKKGTHVKNSYDQIAASIEAANQKALESMATGEKLTAAQQLDINTRKQIDLAVKKGTLTTAEYQKAIEDLAVAVANTSASENFVKWKKEEEKAIKDAEKSYNAMINLVLNASQKNIAALDKQIEKQIQHNSEIGKTKEQIEQIRAAREEADTKAMQGEADRLAAMLEQNTALQDSGDILGLLTPQQENMIRIVLAGLDEEIRKRIRIKGLMLEGASREKDKAAADMMAREWKRGWEEVNKFAHDSFNDWAEKGVSFADSVGKALKKSLLNAIYEATFKPLAMQVYASIVGGPAQGGTDKNGGLIGAALNGGSILGSIDRAASLYNGGGMSGFALSSAGQNLGLSTTGAVYRPAMDAMGPGSSLTGAGEIFSSLPIGGMLTAYSKGGMEGFASGVASTAAAGAISGLISGGGAISGATGALASMGPYGWAALAVMAVLGAKGEYVQSMGESVATVDKDKKIVLGGSGGNNDVSIGGGLNIRQTELSDQFAAKLATTFLTASSKLGITTNGAIFGAGFNNSDGGKFALEATITGKKYDPGQIKTTDANLQLEASRAVFFALQSSELPEFLSGVFDNLTASTATQEQIDSLVAYAQNIKTLHDQLETLPFANLRDLSREATNNLITFAGGLDALGANLGTYYQEFYSAEEKRQQTVKNITKALNAAGAMLTEDQVGNASRETFRKIVEAQDVTTEAGQRNYAMLMSVAGAFASITPPLEDAEKALLETAKVALQSAGNMSAAAVKARADNEALIKTMTGFDAAGLGQMMLDAAFNPTAGMTAAQSFGNALNMSIHNTLVDSVVGQVSRSIFDSIIVPIAAGAAVSQEVTDKIMEDAATKIKALDSLFKSDEFRTTIQNFANSVASLLPEIAALTPASYYAAAAIDSVATSMDNIPDPMEKVRDAQSALEASQNHVKSALESIASQVRAFASAADTAVENIAKGLQTFAKSIDEFLGTIDPARNGKGSLTTLKSQFSTTAVLASSGDEDAKKLLLSQAQLVLNSAKTSSTSAADYARSEAFVRETLMQVRNTAQAQNLYATYTKQVGSDVKVEDIQAWAKQLETRTLADVTKEFKDALVDVGAVVVEPLTAIEAAQKAQAEALAAKALTSNLTLPPELTGLNKLSASIVELGNANAKVNTDTAALAAAMSAANVVVVETTTAFKLTNTEATLLATILGKTGTSATSLINALTNPATAIAAFGTAMGEMSPAQISAFLGQITPAQVGTFLGQISPAQMSTFLGSISDAQKLAFLGAVGPDAISTFLGRISATDKATFLGTVGAEAITTFLGTMTEGQKATFLGKVGADQISTFLGTISEADKETFLGTVGDDAIATFLGTFTDKQKADFLGEIGPEAISTFLGTLTTEQKATFLGKVGADQISTFLGTISEADKETFLGAVGPEAITTFLGTLTTEQKATFLGTIGFDNIATFLGTVTDAQKVTFLGSIGAQNIINFLGVISEADKVKFLGVIGLESIATFLGTVTSEQIGTFLGNVGADAISTFLGTVSAEQKAALFAGVNTALLTGAGGAFAGVNAAIMAVIAGATPAPSPTINAIATYGDFTIKDGVLSNTVTGDSWSAQDAAALAQAYGVAAGIRSGETTAEGRLQAGRAAAAARSIEIGLGSAVDTVLRDMLRGYLPDGVEASFDVGSNYVPRDMVAQIHEGEKITPRAFVDLESSARAETIELLRSINSRIDNLSTQVVVLQRPTIETASSSKRTKEITEQVATGGLSYQTRAKGTPA